jgi:thiamine phosphate synthase YjbQ (UPF0047 family)
VDNKDFQLGKAIQKGDDLDSRLTNIEKKVDEIIQIVSCWKGVIAVYSVLATIAVTIVIKIIWG